MRKGGIEERRGEEERKGETRKEGNRGVRRRKLEEYGVLYTYPQKAGERIYHYEHEC